MFSLTVLHSLPLSSAISWRHRKGAVAQDTKSPALRRLPMLFQFKLIIILGDVATDLIVLRKYRLRAHR
jgi:hypothetical protein